MPIFEYVCRACQHGFEMLVLHNTTPACPSCKSEELEKQTSGFAVNSKDISRANVAKARRTLKHSKDFIDKRVAEAEEEAHHHH